ncbi:disease resistance protein RGA2-like [Rhodamnia argentea]|uniref:Disease resistance protein RGA2-like n=1 Tax=Rhodamnia argentea TaxID=178133 RepID=A0ABM3HPM7_9MYRT|nr:disease resistance protein RGA2-like [Rhodamnia argentea]
MAESLLCCIAEGVLGKIASRALQEAVAIDGVEDQISELRETLAAIKAVLLDEEKQKAKNHSLQVWLDRLQHVLYDAEDVLGELECEALRKLVISRYGNVKEMVCCFFSLSNPLLFRAKVSHKVQEIRKRLSRISIKRDQFDLNVWSADDGATHTRSREMTHSFVNMSDVFGRDHDKEKIIELLQPVGDKSPMMIPIVGIGGLGKTTVVKLVYNNENVKEQFKLRIWVCVSKDFNLKKTIEGIIEHVIDDVWSNDRRKWKELRDMLSAGASESKIIVTTRGLEAASIMDTYPAHNPNGLSHEDSMALPKKWAFDEKEKEPHPKLLESGNDIVENLKEYLSLRKLWGVYFTQRTNNGIGNT